MNGLLPDSHFQNLRFVFPRIWRASPHLGCVALARALFGDATVALLAAGLLAVSPLHIAYSQEARGYSASMLFSLLGVVAMFAELNRPSEASGWKRILNVAIWPALLLLDIIFWSWPACPSAFVGGGAVVLCASLRLRQWPADYAGRALRVVLGLPPGRCSLVSTLSPASVARRRGGLG